MENQWKLACKACAALNRYGIWCSGFKLECRGPKRVSTSQNPQANFGP